MFFPISHVFFACGKKYENCPVIRFVFHYTIVPKRWSFGNIYRACAPLYLLYCKYAEIENAAWFKNHAAFYVISTVVFTCAWISRHGACVFRLS